MAHAVEDGWNIAQVRAKSRHSSLRSLEVYAKPSADAIRPMTDASITKGAARPAGADGTEWAASSRPCCMAAGG
jgi:hypothetical protein